MFSVKLVARPDARMVEVPLEIEAELPREFEGAALLAASGLPRKVRIKSPRDAVKLSTAYRADQLVGDIVKFSLRGTQNDVQRVQEAVTRFIRTVRERRQDGAALVVSSNGRGRIDVLEQMPQPPRAAPRSAAPPQSPPTPPPAAPQDRLAALERRVAELEGTISSMQAQLSRALSIAGVAGPGMDPPAPAGKVAPRSGASPRGATAVEAYAEGLRHELLVSAAAASGRSRSDTERNDKAAALAAEAERLGAPEDGTSQRLREGSAQAAARQSALERLAQEIEFYSAADLPVAWQLLKRLDEGPRPPDPAPALEAAAQAVVRAARGGDRKARTAWLKRAAALCGWTLVEPAAGEPVNAEWHQPVDEGGDKIVRIACPGLKGADGAGLVRARVLVDPAAARLPEEPDEPAAVPEPLIPPGSGEHDSRAEGAKAAAAADDALNAEAEVAAAAEVESARAAEPDPEAAALEKPFAAPFGDLAGAGAPAEGTAKPRIVAEDPARSDEALAAEVALAVETEMSASSSDPDWAQVARGPDAFAAQPAGPDEVPGDDEVDDDDVEELHDVEELGISIRKPDHE